jgi:hypothetical protein
VSIITPRKAVGNEFATFLFIKHFLTDFIYKYLEIGYNGIKVTSCSQAVKISIKVREEYYDATEII